MANKLAKSQSPPQGQEEGRYPYLDQHLIEFVLSIPASQILRPGERRSLMRRSLVGIVPQQVLERSTKQVAARTPTIVLTQKLEEIRQAFHSPFSANCGYIDRLVFMDTLSAIERGAVAPIVSIARTISLELWLRDLISRRLLDVTTKASRPVATVAGDMNA